MLVLVHGFRGDHHGLEPVVAQLPGFRIVSPDLPGFGESATFAGRPHDIDGYADWLGAFIRAVGIDGPYTLLGHSFGSIVAANAAVPRVSRPERLVLVNPIGAPALEGPRGVMTRLAVLYYRTAAALPERAGFALLRNGAIVRVMSVTMAKTRSKSLRRWIHDQHDRYFSAFGDRDAVLEAFHASVSHDVSEVAADIPVPTLLVAAERDDVTPLEAQRRLRRAVPRCHARGDPRGRPPDPLRDAGRRRRAHPPVPALRGARVRIVVDCRYTRIERHDGISRFTAGIVAELGKRHPLTMLVSDHRQLEMLPPLPWQLVSSPTSIREPLVALQVKRLRPDIVFTPMQTMGSWGRNYKLLLTLHDLIYYENRTPPRDLPAPVRLLWRLYHLGLVAAADAPQPRRRGRHRLGDHGRAHRRAPPHRPARHRHPERRRRPRRARRCRARAPRATGSCTWARTCPTRTSTRSCGPSRRFPTTSCTS